METISKKPDRQNIKRLLRVMYGLVGARQKIAEDDLRNMRKRIIGAESDEELTQIVAKMSVDSPELEQLKVMSNNLMSETEISKN